MRFLVELLRDSGERIKVKAVIIVYSVFLLITFIKWVNLGSLL